MHIKRGKVQFNRSDSVDFTTLGAVIVEWLENFKKHTIDNDWAGTPTIYFEEGISEEQANQAWYADIDKMIWAFSVEDDWPPEGSNKEKYKEQILEGRLLFSQRFHNLWW